MATQPVKGTCTSCGNNNIYLLHAPKEANSIKEELEKLDSRTLDILEGELTATIFIRGPNLNSNDTLICNKCVEAKLNTVHNIRDTRIHTKNMYATIPLAASALASTGVLFSHDNILGATMSGLSFVVLTGTSVASYMKKRNITDKSK